jgi:hypothetical protein
MVDNKLKNPLFMLKFVAVLMSLAGVMRLAGLLLPMVFLRRVFIGIPFRELFSFFIEEVGETFNIVNKHLVIYFLLLSVVISFIYLASGIFLIFRKPWARRLIVYSLSIIIPLFFINYILTSLHRGFYLPNFDGILSLIFHIFVFYFFTRPQIKQLFPERTT